jgi:hypothetical protein
VDDAVSGLRKAGNCFLMTQFKKKFKFQIKKRNREIIPLIVPRERHVERILMHSGDMEGTLYSRYPPPPLKE